jgi:hypothetical protein
MTRIQVLPKANWDYPINYSIFISQDPMSHFASFVMHKEIIEMVLALRSELYETPGVRPVLVTPV